MAVSANKEYQVNISSKTITTFFIVIIALAALWVLRNLALVLLTSIVIASFIEYIVEKLKRYRFPRVLSVVIVYVATLIVFSGLFYLVVPIFVEEASDLIQTAQKLIPVNEDPGALSSSSIDNATSLVSDITHGAPLGQILQQSQAFLSSFSAGFFGIATGIFGGIFNFILVIILSFYLSLQERGIEQFIRVVAPVRAQDYVVDLWLRTQRKIGLWIKGQCFLGLLIGVITYIVLSIIGVKYALLLSILSAIAELVPFGIVVATVPAVLFAYLGGGVKLAVIVGLFYFILQQIENYFIVPLVVKRVVGIPPLVVILSVLIGVKLAGFWGLVLGIPVTVLLMEYINDVRKKRIVEDVSKAHE